MKGKKERGKQTAREGPLRAPMDSGVLCKHTGLLAKASSFWPRGTLFLH